MMQGIKKLIDILNEATKAYDEGHPIMSDKEWDDLYFKLVQLENESGIYYENSPTQKVVYKVVNELQKIEHNHFMLSLAKTKELSEIKKFCGNKMIIAMLKLDGLSCSLTYRDGRLVSAETRGNGLVGEDILHNALVIRSIPKAIPIMGEIVVDGEIICTYDNFEPFKEDYANPRNFAAGSIRLLNSKECERRNLTFLAWDCVKGLNDKYLSNKLDNLEYLGFTSVLYVMVNDIEKDIETLKQSAMACECPIDGLVFKYNDCEYYQSLGATDHHFRGGMAYKFYDETYPTRLINIHWTMGRTGVLTPVAVFDPIEIDGTIVERASLHNVSIMREILGDCAYAGQQLEIFKANQIIPQVYSAVKKDYGTVVSHGGVSVDGFSGEMFCPVCGGGTALEKSESGTVNLVCLNPDCEGKLINRLDHFCGKKGLDIKGLSKATLEKVIDWGWVTSARDLYALHLHKNEWISKPGFGKASVEKILSAIEDSKTCELNAFISALGIPLVGKTIAKEIVKYYSTWEEFREAVGGTWSDFDGFGPEIEKSINSFDYTIADQLGYLLDFKQKESNKTVADMSNLTFCITGKVNIFKNRDALKTYIESAGGKVVGSMSSKVNYLINNDNTSTSAKNVSAQAAGIPIITEAEFMALFGQNS